MRSINRFGVVFFIQYLITFKHFAVMFRCYFLRMKHCIWRYNVLWHVCLYNFYGHILLKRIAALVILHSWQTLLIRDNVRWIVEELFCLNFYTFCIYCNLMGGVCWKKCLPVDSYGLFCKMFYFIVPASYSDFVLFPCHIPICLPASFAP